MFDVLVRGVRGATTVEANSVEAILEATRELLAAMLKANETDVEYVASAFFTTTVDLNAEFPAVAVLGHVYPELIDELGVIDGVDSVVRISKPFKLASREVQSENTVVRLGSLAIGDGSICVMAGPCSVDSEETVVETAKAVKAA